MAEDRGHKPRSGAVRYFGDYELEPEPIGRGGMGVVYRARQISLNRPVAIKMMTVAGPLATDEHKQRFRTEAEAAASLDHPNIVSVYEVGEHDGFSYLSMKLVDGHSLASALAQGRFARTDPLALRRSATLVIDVARAVHFAHQRGVLHRDLKPANILLDHEGRPHVADFGLAKLVQAETSPTLTEASFGTPAYMAPEQVRSARSVTMAADIYSLGAILYELLAGRPPFAGESTQEILHQVVARDPVPPSRVNANLPSTANTGIDGRGPRRAKAIDRDLEIICLKCLEKEPARRYATAEALADDLDRWRRDEPIQARSVSLIERGVKWVRRHRTVAGLSAGLCAAIVVGTGVANWLRSRAEFSRVQQEFAQIEADASTGIASALPRLAALVRQFPDHPIAVPRLVHALVHHSFLLPVSNHVSAGQTLGLDWQVRRRVASPRRNEWIATATNADDMTRIMLWTHGQTTPVVIPAHRLVIRSLAASADGTRLVSAGADGAATIWEVVSTMNARPLSTLSHPAAVYHAEFSPTGSRVVTAGFDGTIRLWNVHDGQLLAQTSPSGAPVIVVRFSPDRARILSGGEDQWLRIWTAETLQPAAEPLRVDASIEDVRFLDNSRVQASLEDNREQTFALTQVGLRTHADQLVELTPFIAHAPAQPLVSEITRRMGEQPVVCGAAPQARLVAVGHGKEVQIWDARARQPFVSPLAHADLVNAVQFSPDGVRLVTSTTGNRLRVWDVRSAQPLTEPLLADGIVTNAAFTRDGRHVIAQLSSGAHQAWPLYATAGPAQPWLPDLGEAIAGFRFNGREKAPATQTWSEVRAELWRTPHLDGRDEWAKHLLPAP